MGIRQRKSGHEGYLENVSELVSVFFITSTVMLGWLFSASDAKAAPYFGEFITFMIVITLLGTVGPIFLHAYTTQTKKKMSKLAEDIKAEENCDVSIPVFFTYAPLVAFLFATSFIVMFLIWVRIGYFI